MNRRDFLSIFRGLAVLPFVRMQPHAEPMTDSEVEEVRREYEALPPDDPRIDIGKLVSGGEFASGQAVYMSEYTGRLEVWNGEGHIIGIAARDIAPGEVVEWRIGGNSKDIITSGIARVTWAD